MHPMLHLAANQPQLLARHLEAYAELLGEEFVTASAQWKRRALLQGLALCGVGVSAVLAGVAAMLWAVTPDVQMFVPWVLVATPLLPLLVSVVCLWAAHRASEGESFETFRRQVRADLDLWREAQA